MLTSKQRAYLRGLANGMETILIIGKGEITDNVIMQADTALTARELIKGRVLENSAYSSREAADSIAEKCSADVVQVIGSKFVLYRPNPDEPVITLPKAKNSDKGCAVMINTDYKAIIRALMGDYRFDHSVNVAAEAVELAKLYGEDEEKAYTAGILHDITKEIPKDEQLKIIADGGILLDDVQKNAPKLWHSISGSVYIQTELGITDSDIINAVRYHTTGRANMSLLEKIIYIADYTAVGREYNGVEIMREKSRKSLEEAMIFSFQYTFNNLSSKEVAIHPDEIFAYNYIVLNKERNKP